MTEVESRATGMLTFHPYLPEHKSAWDSFVDRSKNGIFQFRRDYMEYHADRFMDASLIATSQDGDIVALLPASVHGEEVISHAGLTFGGFVTDNRMKAARMLELFERLRDWLVAQGKTSLVYKTVPHIYHSVPSEEDRYALFRVGAQLVRCDISSSIRSGARLKPSKGRHAAVKQAIRMGLEVEQSDSFADFMKVEEQLLADKYATRPTHTGDELTLLASRFPKNILLHVVRRGGEIIAGVVIYRYATVAHAQYIAATGEGKRAGALDLILEKLISETYADVPVFDFGISTEQQGTVLNEGLIANKQSFGARGVVYDTFRWDLRHC